MWDWSRPTLWLLQKEILRADWRLVARRLGDLVRAVTAAEGYKEESQHVLMEVMDTHFIHTSHLITPHSTFPIHYINPISTQWRLGEECV